MITLYGFGPGFGLPDPSPFVMKALVLMEMSGLPYDRAKADLGKAPKGKAPYLKDGNEIIADSTFIRFHLEDKHGIDFDPGLSDEQKAIAWAFEKMCDEHLYFAMLNDRWVNDDNFNRGPVKFFKPVPALIRPLIIAKVRRDIKKVTLRGQGTGRHSDAEIARLTLKSLKSISDVLGDKPFLMGVEPCSADASVFGFVAGFLCTRFESATRSNAEKFPNLTTYRDRCMTRWFPDFAGEA